MSVLHGFFLHLLMSPHRVSVVVAVSRYAYIPFIIPIDFRFVRYGNVTSPLFNPHVSLHDHSFLRINYYRISDGVHAEQTS